MQYVLGAGRFREGLAKVPSSLVAWPPAQWNGVLGMEALAWLSHPEPEGAFPGIVLWRKAAKRASEAQNGRKMET